VAFRQVLDKILQKDGFPIGNSSSEYDSLTKRLLDLWGQRRKTLNTTRHSEATDATPNASLSRVVPTGLKQSYLSFSWCSAILIYYIQNETFVQMLLVYELMIWMMILL